MASLPNEDVFRTKKHAEEDFLIFPKKFELFEASRRMDAKISFQFRWE